MDPRARGRYSNPLNMAPTPRWPYHTIPGPYPKVALPYHTWHLPQGGPFYSTATYTPYANPYRPTLGHLCEEVFATVARWHMSPWH